MWISEYGGGGISFLRYWLLACLNSTCLVWVPVLGIVYFHIHGSLIRLAEVFPQSMWFPINNSTHHNIYHSDITVLGAAWIASLILLGPGAFWLPGDWFWGFWITSDWCWIGVLPPLNMGIEPISTMDLFSLSLRATTARTRNVKGSHRA